MLSEAKDLRRAGHPRAKRRISAANLRSFGSQARLRMTTSLEVRARVSLWTHRRFRLTLLEVQAAEKTARAVGHIQRHDVSLAAERDQHGTGAQVVQRLLKRSRALHAGRAKVRIPGTRQIVGVVVLRPDAQPEVRVLDETGAAERVTRDRAHVGDTEREADDVALGAALQRQRVGAR